MYRNIVRSYLIEMDNEINETAELDKNQFWKLVNSKRKNTNSKSGAEMVFNGTAYRDPNGIKEQWTNYFETLYSPSDFVHYDNEGKTNIDQFIQHVVSHSVLKMMSTFHRNQSLQHFCHVKEIKCVEMITYIMSMLYMATRRC